MSDAHRLLSSNDPDPTVPAPGQRWQARGDVYRGNGGGEVAKICFIDTGVVHFRPDRTFYVLIENLVTHWWCVDHLPLYALMVYGRPVKTWREMCLALIDSLPKEGP